MAKAIALYYGWAPTTSQTPSVSMEAATREDGKNFCRAYLFNGFQNAWSKWTYAPFIRQIDEVFIRHNDVVMHLCPKCDNLRLPN